MEQGVIEWQTPELYLLKREGIALPEGKKLRLGYSKTPTSCIRVKPCLLQNAARHISGCYGDLCAAEINGNHKLLAGKGSEVVDTCSKRVVVHQGFIPLIFAAVRLTPLPRQGFPGTPP